MKASKPRGRTAKEQALPAAAPARADASSEVQRVVFEYKFPQDYNPLYVNGAHGGWTTQGEVVLNFYLERQPLPYSETHGVQSSGALGEKLGRKPEPHDGEVSVIRYVSTGIVLSRESAQRIHSFLGRIIDRGPSTSEDPRATKSPPRQE